MNPNVPALKKGVAATRRWRKPTPSQQSEVEGEGSQKKALGPMVRTPRQATFQEAMPPETLTLPSKCQKGRVGEVVTCLMCVYEIIAVDGQSLSLRNNIAFHQMLHHLAL